MDKRTVFSTSTVIGHAGLTAQHVSAEGPAAVSEPAVISVVLDNNRKADTLACLRSLCRNTYGNHRIIVLDNACTDGSVQAVQASFPEVRIIPLPDNLGYAGNNNVGLEAALSLGAEWVFILNDDTVVAPDCLRQLMRVASRDVRTGIAGPTIYHFDEPEVIQSAGGTLGSRWECVHLGQNETDLGHPRLPHAVDWVSGCALFVSRTVIEHVGMLDTRFFLYFEETEWCLRARNSGWRVVHVPEAKVWHKGVRRDYRPVPAVTYYSTRNRLLMMQKHRAPMRVRAMAWIQIVRTLASWTVKPKWRAMNAHRDAMWQGALDFLRGRWGQMP